MKLIVGLGNPGPEYEKTRHNAGWVVVDTLLTELVATAGFQAGDWEKGKDVLTLRAEIALSSGSSERLIFLKPQQFMNRSGEGVRRAAKSVLGADFELAGHDLIVIHDDVDLELGEVKMSINRGSAGHNGVQNIIDHLKTKDFIRFRIGIRANAVDRVGTERFVLMSFSKTEHKKIEESAKRCAAGLVLLLEKGFSHAQNHLHSHIQT